MKTFYYSSDSKIFKNKFEAIEYNRQTGNKIFFYYDDDIWSKLDWTIEPPGTLDFHYKNQAQRIRDEYDYVVLFYSGGYDSTNILETFHFNNIKLDKIVCVGAFKQDSYSGSDENHNGELYMNSFPYLVDLGLEKITQICDYSEYFGDIKNFSIHECGTEWVEDIGPWFSPHNFFWKDVHKHVVPENMKDKKVALIWGKDKPNIEPVGDKFGFKFTDVAALSYAGNNSVDNIDRINFYWDPNYPLILLKQVHELNRLRGKRDTVDPNRIYNLRRNLTYKSPKSPNNILSLRDNFLLNNKNSALYDLYVGGLNRLKTKYKLNSNPPHFYSRIYTIT
jgi:hypothetical protein